MPERKEYVLVSSDAREPSSASTTDFTVKMQVPLVDVIRTDLVQVAMTYLIANVVGCSFTIEEGLDGSGELVSRTLTLEDGLYTPYSLCEEIKYLLGADYEVSLTALGSIIIQNTVAASLTNRNLVVTDTKTRTIFGMTSNTQSPEVYNDLVTWRMTRSVTLTDNQPYMFIKSRFLGTPIRYGSEHPGFLADGAQ